MSICSLTVCSSNRRSDRSISAFNSSAGCIWGRVMVVGLTPCTPGSTVSAAKFGRKVSRGCSSVAAYISVTYWPVDKMYKCMYIRCESC